MPDFNYHLGKIQILSLFLSPEINRVNSDNLVLNYGINVDNRVSEQILEGKEFINSHVSITISYEKENLVIFEVSNIFNIEGLKNAVTTDDTGKHLIPIDILDKVALVSISVTRGLLFSNLRGTKLHNAILPLVELNQEPEPL
ncbi:hypothetical protein L0657_06795 [Dyadobacter sp. CY345]|uniref:hypothetical protein n=1 Tax=Dyadobacter sp. CY345 TaxID=2909335 RepID=UPI001F38A892|nr:hypothetical protein [Dyadobacter sp. CY345]MCF2443658.1 hypothetical protein [Dyadobacter sp. CY345]